MSNEYRYFKVTGGAISAAVDAFVANRQTQIDARNALKAQFGATGTYGNNHGLDALVFDVAPAGWRPVKYTTNVYKPPLGKVGTAIRKQLRESRIDGAQQFHELVCSNGFGFIDLPRIRFIVYEKVGETLILCVPNCEDAKSWTPPDDHCHPLKTSEYWALKEASESV